MDADTIALLILGALIGILLVMVMIICSLLVIRRKERTMREYALTLAGRPTVDETNTLLSGRVLLRELPKHVSRMNIPSHMHCQVPVSKVV